MTDEHWSLVNNEYAICDAGLMQSPTELGAANAKAHVALETALGPTNGVKALSQKKVLVDLPSDHNREMFDMMGEALDPSVRSIQPAR